MTPMQVDRSTQDPVPRVPPPPRRRSKSGWQVECAGMPQALDVDGLLFDVHDAVAPWMFRSRGEAATARDATVRMKYNSPVNYRIVQIIH